VQKRVVLCINIGFPGTFSLLNEYEWKKGNPKSIIILLIKIRNIKTELINKLLDNKRGEILALNI